MTPDNRKELFNTGVIGASGFATGALAGKLGKAIPSISNHAGKMGALVGGLGLVGDYAAVKLNKHFNAMHDNKYLNKIASSIKE